MCPFPFLCCKDGCESDKPQNRTHPGGTRQGRDGRGRPSQAERTRALTAFVTHNPRGRNAGSRTRLPERKAEGGLPPSPPLQAMCNLSHPFCYITVQLFWSYASAFVLFFKHKQHECYSQYCLFHLTIYPGKNSVQINLFYSL